MPLPRRTARRLALAFTAALALPAAAEVIDKPSPYPVAETIDRLSAAAEAAGATVFARIDHAEGAANHDLTLPPSQLLIFGNPKLGTPAMQDAPRAGLDLPLKILAWEDAEGQVRLSYHSPEDLAATHDLPSDAAYLTQITKALDTLTSKAVAQE